MNEFSKPQGIPQPADDEAAVIAELTAQFGSVEAFRAFIQKGIDSGPAKALPPDYFEKRKAALLERMQTG